MAWAKQAKAAALSNAELQVQQNSLQKRRGLLQNTGRDGTAFSAVGPTERPAGVLEFNPRT
jgi:hypothetical protein